MSDFYFESILARALQTCENTEFLCKIHISSDQKEATESFFFMRRTGLLSQFTTPCGMLKVNYFRALTNTTEISMLLKSFLTIFVLARRRPTSPFGICPRAWVDPLCCHRPPVADSSTSDGLFQSRHSCRGVPMHPVTVIIHCGSRRAAASPNPNIRHRHETGAATPLAAAGPGGRVGDPGAARGRSGYRRARSGRGRARTDGGG